MRKFVNPLSILTLITVALVLLSVATDRRASAQGSTSVLVVNPLSSPVPVTGHVTFAGEHGHPLAVQLAPDPDSPGRNPYQSFKFGTTSCTLGLCVSSCTFDAVPAGKRLVAKFASSMMTTPVGGTFSGARLILPGGDIGLPPPVLIGASSGFNQLTVSANLNAYVDQGTAPIMDFQSSMTVFPFRCSLSGDLVSVP